MEAWRAQRRARSPPVVLEPQGDLFVAKPPPPPLSPPPRPAAARRSLDLGSPPERRLASPPSHSLPSPRTQATVTALLDDVVGRRLFGAEPPSQPASPQASSEHAPALCASVACGPEAATPVPAPPPPRVDIARLLPGEADDPVVVLLTQRIAALEGELAALGVTHAG